MQKDEVTFSLINVFIVILLIAGMIVLGLKYLHPRRYLNKNIKEIQDETRLTEIRRLETAIQLYIADGKNFDTLTTGKIYSSNEGDNQANGQGWLPLDFLSVSSGTPLSKLPVDTEEGFYYQVGVDVHNKTYEIACRFKTPQLKDKSKTDNGNNPEWYEIGSNLNILNN